MKSVSEKKGRGVTERPGSVNPSKAIQWPSALSLFILVLSASSMHDVACEFACAVRMRRNGANVLKF